MSGHNKNASKRELKRC